MCQMIGCKFLEITLAASGKWVQHTEVSKKGGWAQRDPRWDEKAVERGQSMNSDILEQDQWTWRFTGHRGGRVKRGSFLT